MVSRRSLLASPRAVITTGAFLVAAATALGVVGGGPMRAVLADGAAPSEACRWVRQLGAVEFAQRQEASRQLLDIGPGAITALRAARQDSQYEIRLRAGQLLERILRNRHEELLELLTTGTAGPLADELPGWRLLALIAGDTPAARKLYREMLLAEPELLQLLDDDAAALRPLLARRVESLAAALRIGQYRTVEAGSSTQFAVLLLIAVSQRLDPPWSMPELLLDATPLPQADELWNNPDAEPLRRLLSVYVQTPDAGSSPSRMKQAARFRLPEGVEPAREIALDQRRSARERRDAVAMIARYGGLEHLPDLERLLDDEAEVESSTRRLEVVRRTRMQDVALAAIVRLTAQDPAAYGFAAGTGNGAGELDLSRVGFATPDARAEALRRYRTWRAVNLRSPLFGPLDAIAGDTL